MDTTLSLQTEQVRWGLGLMLGFPVLMIVLSELLGIARRRYPMLASTLWGLRNLVVPLAALMILLAHVAELPADGFAVRIMQTIFWIALLYTGLTFVNDVIFSATAAGSWQERVPKLVRDLARALLVALGAGIIYSRVWGESLEGALTALGVGSIVIGLALQEPLGNIVSGLMLLFERPISLGDWVQIDGTIGKVIEINWRSAHIETGTRELFIVPNSQLYKGSFRNLSRPTPLRTEVVELGFSYDDPPNKVKAMLMELLQTTPGVLDDPPPLVRTRAYADFAIVYAAIFTVASQDRLAAIRDAFMTRVWYACQRTGISIPFPTAVEYQPEVKPPDPRKAHKLLRQFPQFVPADDGKVLDDPSFQVGMRSFAVGERVVGEGDESLGLCLVLSGVAALLARDSRGNDREIARVGRGEFFGENCAQTRQPSELTVRAVEDLEILILEPEAVHTLLDYNPRLGRDLGHVLDVRRKAVTALRRSSRGAGE